MEVPTLFVDAGNLFTDDRFADNHLPAEVMTKNQWVVKSYADFHQDAANISYADLPYVAELFKKDGYDKRVEDYPFIDNLVSANIKPLDDSRKAPKPYVIREVKLSRAAAGKKLRIAFVGLTDSKPNAMGGGAQAPHQSDYAGYHIDDIFEAAKRIIPEAKQKADMVVVLAYVQQDTAQRLASENPDIDTIIGAWQTSMLNEPEHFGRATITFAYNQTKYLGEMRYYLHGDGTVESQVNRYVSLDSDIPDDPLAADAVTNAHNDFTNLQKTAAEANAPPTPQPISQESGFVGASMCAGCHAKEYDTWQSSNHAHAMATLEHKNEQFDNECVRCHVVGFNQGGFQSLTTTPQLANVQCEACHGPGKDHVAKPAKGYGFMATPVGCVQCHTQSNSPDFNFSTYWPKIQHGTAH